MARLALAVRCAGCGREFDTGIRMDDRNFARATFAANYHACPRCGRRGTYHKQDYLLREDHGPSRHRHPDGADVGSDRDASGPNDVGAGTGRRETG
jgi:DNA-directed RNA polymerase subunit RPC12/RpoP